MVSRDDPGARRVGWLSLAQLISWRSVFYTFAMLLEPWSASWG